MQSQQAKAQAEFIARAKILAHVMTSCSNIEVTISGNTAYCSYGEVIRINLPAGDYTDPKFCKMVQGWIDHELGHADESDPKVMLEASKNKALKEILGRVEDVRMETSRGRKYRGAKTNLAVLAELAIERELFKMPDEQYSIGTLIINHILYRGRSKVIGQKCLDEFASIGHSLVAEHVNQPFADGLNQLIDKTATLTDSQGSLDLSREILAFIQQEDEDQQQQQNPDQADNPDNQDSKDDSDQQNSQSDSSGSDDQTSDDNQSGSSGSGDSSDTDNSNTDSSSNSSNTDPSGDSSDDNGASNSGATDDGTSNDDIDVNGAPTTPSSSNAQPLKIIESMDEADVKDFHEAIAEMISDDVAQQPTSSVTPEFDFVECSKRYDFDSSALDVSLARRLSGNVFQAMHKVLIDIQPELPVTRKRGKRINTRLFSGIPAGNMKVFHSRVEQEVREAAVSLVIDASPSMEGLRMKHANTCALAFAMALKRLNIAFEVVYYGSKAKSRFEMYRAKTFDAPLKNNAFEVLMGNWSTPTGEAMQFALSSLALRKENNKLMLLLTDGDPDCSNRVRQSHQLAKAFGVNVVPFALCTEYVSGFEKHEFVSIPEPSALTPALRQATKQKLFA